MRLIHYGSNAYKEDRFVKVTNSMWHSIKPSGGLWTSPIDSDFGWIDWCIENEFGCDLSKSFTIKISPDTRICKIDCADDLDKLPWLTKEFDSGWTLHCIDFEKARRSYDAVWLTYKGERETRYTKPRNLYGWDCESVVILNKEVIQA